MLDAGLIVRVAIVLFVIMDPFASVPVFLALTKRARASEKSRAVVKAATVAGLTLILFTVAGPPFLTLIGVSMSSFMVAGGLMLLLISILMVLGMSYGQSQEHTMDVAAVLVAVPLITGPGAMTAAIILASTNGLQNVIVSILLAALGMYVVLSNSKEIYRVLGSGGTEFLSRISGLVLAAIAVEFMRAGLGL